MHRGGDSDYLWTTYSVMTWSVAAWRQVPTDPIPVGETEVAGSVTPTAK